MAKLIWEHPLRMSPGDGVIAMGTQSDREHPQNTRLFKIKLAFSSTHTLFIFKYIESEEVIIMGS